MWQTSVLLQHTELGQGNVLDNAFVGSRPTGRTGIIESGQDGNAADC